MNVEGRIMWNSTRNISTI